MKRKNVFLLVFVMIFAACSSDSDDGGSNQPPSDQPDVSQLTIWTGPILEFTKAAGADPTLPANQDRITDNVWITRADGGGQIFNAASETEATKETSPAGTLWARGTTANINNLTFNTFRGTLDKPKDNIGVDLVMVLVEDQIALDVKITGWTQQEQGGFIYERSTME